MKQRLIAVFAMSAVVLAVGAGASRAQEQGNAQLSSGQRGACKDDIQNLCKDQQKGAILTCLMGNLGQIQNATCKAHVTSFKEKDDAVKQMCSKDIEADKCSGMDIGTGLLKCLGANRSSLSDDCKAELKQLRHERRGAHRAHGNGGENGGSSSGNGATGGTPAAPSGSNQGGQQ